MSNRTGNLTNYHSHSLYCDGRANMEDFIRFALSEGFTSYGFSSHAPLPFSTAWTMEWDAMDDYLAEFHRLKAKYYDDKGEIVDVDVTADKFRRLVDKHFNGDLVRVVHLYYDRLMRMVELGGFDIVGHADKMHYNASAYHPGLLDEPWYDALIQEYFDAIARKGYIVEINTKSFLELGTFYPNERYFPVLLEKGIRVQVNSDSHYPERINNGRLQALMALQASGYHTVTEMYNNEWKNMPLLIHT